VARWSWSLCGFGRRRLGRRDDRQSRYEDEAVCEYRDGRKGIGEKCVFALRRSEGHVMVYITSAFIFRSY